MKLLELFCGTKSISKEFSKLGFEVTTLDIDPSFEPDIIADILKWTPTGEYDVIWASPPCTTFSVQSLGRHWTRDHKPKTDKAAEGLLILERTVEIIKELNPKYFFIENPMGKMRRMSILDEFERAEVTYCQYNDPHVEKLIWNMTDKKCPGCGQIKEIGEFYKNKSRRDGFHCYCKSCANIQHKNYVEANKDRLREYDKAQYWLNHEKHLENKRASSQRNREGIRLRARERYIDDREAILAKDKEYRMKNKEKRRASARRYYAENSEAYKVRARERKMLKRKVSDGTITNTALVELYKNQEGLCGYCSCDLESTTRHLDHIVPLSRGGLHTLVNVHWTCAECNLSKKDQTEEEWFKKERMKPTDIWHNSPWIPRPKCKRGAPCHTPAPRGSKTGTQGMGNSIVKGVIPPELAREIAECLIET